MKTHLITMMNRWFSFQAVNNPFFFSAFALCYCSPLSFFLDLFSTPFSSLPLSSSCQGGIGQKGGREGRQKGGNEPPPGICLPPFSSLRCVPTPFPVAIRLDSQAWKSPIFAHGQCANKRWNQLWHGKQKVANFYCASSKMSKM